MYKNPELKYALFIFVFGSLFMLIPNITTGYPIGHDSQSYLGNLRIMNEINFQTGMIYLTPMLPFIFSLLSFQVDMITFLKFYPIFMYGFHGVTVYYYARVGLRWDARKSVLASLILLSSAIALYTGYNLHSQLLSLSLLFVLLTQLKVLMERKHATFASTLRDHRLLLVFPLVILIGWSHVIISGMLFFILSLEFVKSLAERRKDSIVFILSGAALVSSYLIFSFVLMPEPFRDLNPQNLLITFDRPLAFDGGLPWLFSLFLFSFVILVPFSILGIFKDSQLLAMLAFLTVFSLLYVINPSLGLLPPDRTVKLYQYPLAIFAANGIARVGEYRKFLPRYKKTLVAISTKARRTAAAAILSLLVFQSLNGSGLFEPISLLRNPPIGYPTSAQWSGVHIPEIDHVIALTQWYNEHIDSSSILIVPEGAFGWVKYHLKEESYVAKWHPDTELSPFIIDGQLVVIRAKSPRDIIETDDQYILTHFDRVYLMDVPSWRNVEGAFDGLCGLEMIKTVGDVSILRITKSCEAAAYG